MISQRERCSEARRLDSVECRIGGATVICRSADAEVRRALIPARELGANAYISRLQALLIQLGVVRLDRRRKGGTPRRIEVVVDLLDPLHVRAEARSPREVERHVNTEAGGI